MSNSTFEMKNTVVVHINTEDGGREVVSRFLRFCLNEGITPLRLGSAGPSGAYKPVADSGPQDPLAGKRDGGYA